MGTFVHAVEDEMLCSSTLPDKVPYFNAPIYLQNKSVIGKVDEILGPINEVFFSIKMGEGMVANSFKKGDKVYIAGDKLLPLERFLPKPKVVGGMWYFAKLYVFSLKFAVQVFPVRSYHILLT
jgi:H/ACA ribonucleoprotein complex subunit 1